MDAIYTYGDYSKDGRPRLQFPKRTGKRTSYGQWLEYQYGLHHDGALPAAGDNRPPALTFVNHGRWLWQCPGCFTAVQVSESGDGADLTFCPACFGQEFVQPEFPAERAEIEAELLRQPGYRWNAPFRNWEPGDSVAYLQERTAKAQAQIDQGETFVRAASIATPRTWSVGEVLSASNMNTYVREIQRDLIGTNGAIELLHGVRPGSFSTNQINALSGIEDGVMMYNSTTQRHEYFVGGNRRGFAGVHQSGLFAAGEVVTVNHDLGFAPRSFQLLYERVGASAQHGHDNGDKVYVGDGGLPPGSAVFDVLSSSYKVALPSARETVLWLNASIGNSGGDLWKLRAGNASNHAGGFGNQGALPTQNTYFPSMVWFDDALWANRGIQIWKFDPDNPDRTTGGFGNQGNIAGLQAGAYYLFTWDGALWLNESRTGISTANKIDHTDPTNTSGDFVNRDPMAAQVTYVTELDGAVYGVTTGDVIWKFDPTDWDNISGGFGSQGAYPTNLGTDKGLAGHEGALWTIDSGNDSVWKIDPANPGNETMGLGRQEVITSSFPTPRGLAASEGEIVQTAYITAASGDLAGFQAEITVDNDAAAGGWGARMLAFA